LVKRLRLDVLVVDIGELDEMEAGVTCCCCAVPPRGQGGLPHPWDAGHLLAGGVLPALSRRTVRETFPGMPDHVMNYVESDAPAELTLVEWRRVRAAAATRRRRSLRSLLPVRHRVAFA
jgi:hypothetical protein